MFPIESLPTLPILYATHSAVTRTVEPHFGGHSIEKSNIFTARQESFGKVMFSVVSICLSVHKGGEGDALDLLYSPSRSTSGSDPLWTSDMGPLWPSSPF